MYITRLALYGIINIIHNNSSRTLFLDKELSISQTINFPYKREMVCFWKEYPKSPEPYAEKVPFYYTDPKYRGW